MRVSRGNQSKYRNIPETVDGIRFSSKAEARRYQELKLLQRAGKIRNLVLQPRFPLIVNGVKVCTYVADFQYEENEKKIIEDVKGIETAVFKIKKKLVEAIYGFDILITK